MAIAATVPAAGLMIPKKHAELLELPPETSPAEARERCQRLLENVRLEMAQLPAMHPDWTELEQRCMALEIALKELSDPDLLEEEIQEPGISNLRFQIPESAAPIPSPVLTADRRVDIGNAETGVEASSPSESLPEEIRKTLDLQSNAAPEQALASAEARLQETIDAQNALRPKHPAHPRLKRDRERFERMAAELRELTFGRKVDELCDRAEETLNAKPANKANARDLLRRARLESRQLPPESACMRRLQNLETQLDGESSPVMAPSPANVGSATPANPPLPTPPVPAIRVTTTTLRESPFQLLENLVDKGMACLAQDTPDETAAQECFAEAEKEAAGKKIPDNLRNRMQLFKRTLDQVRRETLHAQADAAFKQACTALAEEPPDIAGARVKLDFMERLLQEVPDPFWQAEAGRLARSIEEHEHWLTLRRQNIEEIPSEVSSMYPEQTEPEPAPESVFAAVESPPSVSEKTSDEAPPPSSAPASTTKRGVALQFGLAMLFIGLIGAAVAGFRMFKGALDSGEHTTVPTTNKLIHSPDPFVDNKPPGPLPNYPQDIGTLSVNVTPSGAELFTNGVSVGHPEYPAFLHGLSGEQITLEARLEGYSNANKIVAFPSPQSPRNEELELAPKPGVLIVHSEPPAAELHLREGKSAPLTQVRSEDGIEIPAGEPLELSLQIPDYEIVGTNLPALRPGERRVVDFGKLKMQTASLRLKADTPKTKFTLAYPGHEPVPFGSTPLIQGIVPRTAFQVIASAPGYASASNSFVLQPRETASYDFGKLRPLPASLFLTGTPDDFNLKVSWDGASRDYGATGQISGLPPGKDLLITASGTGFEPLSTNLNLDPGEKRELYFSGLQPARSYLLLKSDPSGTEVTYSLDGHFPIYAGVTERLDGLPLGHGIEVTLHKSGYHDRTLTNKLVLAGDTLDFGRLTPVNSTNNNNAKNHNNTNDLTGIPKLISPEKASANLQKAKYTEAAIQLLVKEIEAHILKVRTNVPLTQASRQDWNEWINKVEAMHHTNAVIWSRLQPPLQELRQLVNQTTPSPIVPVAASSQ